MYPLLMCRHGPVGQFNATFWSWVPSSLSLFIISVDGMIGKKAFVVLMNLSQLIVVKLEERILHVHGWVNGRIVITITTLYSCIIYASENCK